MRLHFETARAVDGELALSRRARLHRQLITRSTNMGMLWPDELRDSSFAAPPGDVTVSDAEISMAQSFIDALAGDFNPEDFTDSYREALEALVQSKAEGVPLAEEPEAPKEAEVVDLVAALRASVEAAKKRREEAESAKAM